MIKCMSSCWCIKKETCYEYAPYAAYSDYTYNHRLVLHFSCLFSCSNYFSLYVFCQVSQITAIKERLRLGTDIFT